MLLTDQNSLLYYDDAISHLVIARRVMDSLTPGLAQFGSVWLPMTHLLLLPFTANNFLFQTGLAGTIVSGISTAIAAVFLFRIVRLHFSKNFGFLAAALFLMNTSVIYMGLVPMMEAPFMMFFMMAAYYALNWYLLYNNGIDMWLQYRSILKCAIAISAATLTRYEAWFFPMGLVLMILIVLLFGRKELWKRKIEAFVFIALPYSMIGILVWIVYNGIIFRNPLLFFVGPYSAQAQSLTRPYRQYLYLQPGNAISTIFSVATDMYGLHVVLLSIAGACVFIFMKRKKSLLFALVTLGILGFPILLDWAAMIQGSGEIYRHIVTGWFNGRYLIFVAPLFAFSVTALVAFVAGLKKRVLTGMAVTLVLSFYVTSMLMHPMAVGYSTALSDGKIMPYRGDVPYAIDLGKGLKEVYAGGNIADFTLSKSSPIIRLFSGIPLKHFIDVNNKDYWEDSKNEPWTHVDYVILQRPVDHSNGVHINQSEYYDPIRGTIIYWNNNLREIMSPYQPIGNSWLSNVSIVYQNYNFLILKNQHKDLVIEKFSDHLQFPSNIAILGKDDILFSEKKSGVVHRITDGKMVAQPLLDVNVATRGERGVLGMAALKNENRNTTYVFLYYTESKSEDGDDVQGYREPLGNRLYRYELINNKLMNPKLLLDLPVGPPNKSTIGKVIIGPDDSVYVLANNIVSSTGNNFKNDTVKSPSINLQGGQIKITGESNRISQTVDESSKIIRISQDGTSLPINIANINGNTVITIKGKQLYTYSIGNSYSIDFDPLSKSIWFAGNREIEDSYPSFNKTTNAMYSPNDKAVTIIDNLNINKTVDNSNLGISSAGLRWNKNMGPLEVSFVNSARLGEQYKNDFFVGDIVNGSLYRFDLDTKRDHLFLNGSLTDRVVNGDAEIKPKLVLNGLGGIADLETGDDGYVYFSTLGGPYGDEEKSPSSFGAIYRLKAFGK